MSKKGDVRILVIDDEESIRRMLRVCLEGTPYARSFLLGLPHNSALLAAAEAYGCIPAEIERLLQHTEG